MNDLLHSASSYGDADLPQPNAVSVTENGGFLFTIAPAPKFSCGSGVASLATIYFSHYQRLSAVLDAARTGNKELIKLAVAHQDAKGSNE